MATNSKKSSFSLHHLPSSQDIILTLKKPSKSIPADYSPHVIKEWALSLNASGVITGPDEVSKAWFERRLIAHLDKHDLVNIEGTHPQFIKDAEVRKVAYGQGLADVEDAVSFLISCICGDIVSTMS